MKFHSFCGAFKIIPLYAVECNSQFGKNNVLFLSKITVAFFTGLVPPLFTANINRTYSCIFRQRPKNFSKIPKNAPKSPVHKSTAPFCITRRRHIVILDFHRLNQTARSAYCKREALATLLRHVYSPLSGCHHMLPKFKGRFETLPFPI